MRQMFPNDMPARRPEDIAYKEDIHPPNPSMLVASAFRLYISLMYVFKIAL